MEGFPRWSRRSRAARLAPVATFLLCHRHRPEECRVVFAAFKGFDSPLRHTTTLGTCRGGGHRLWWRVEATDAAAALAALPEYVCARTEAIEVAEVRIP
jgi:hypothetical protein